MGRRGEDIRLGRVELRSRIVAFRHRVGQEQVLALAHVPGDDLTRPVAVLACVYLMLNLIGETWARFGVWKAIGQVLYFVYRMRNGRLARKDPFQDPSVS
jgi:C-terminus of AA_permease